MNWVRFATALVRDRGARLTCRDFIAFLDDYVAGSLDERTTGIFRQHVAQCPACARYLAGYAATVRMGYFAFHASDDAIPDSVPEALVSAIVASRRAQ